MLDFADLVLPSQHFDEIEKSFITRDLTSPNVWSRIFAISDAQILANRLLVDNESQTVPWHLHHYGIGRRHDQGSARYDQ